MEHEKKLDDLIMEIMDMCDSDPEDAVPLAIDALARSIGCIITCAFDEENGKRLVKELFESLNARVEYAYSIKDECEKRIH